MYQSRYPNERRKPSALESIQQWPTPPVQPDLTVQFDLNQDQMTALLEQCLTEGRPVQDICRSAIAHYLQHKDLLAYNTAKALAD